MDLQGEFGIRRPRVDDLARDHVGLRVTQKGNRRSRLFGFTTMCPLIRLLWVLLADPHSSFTTSYNVSENLAPMPSDRDVHIFSRIDGLVHILIWLKFDIHASLPSVRVLGTL